MLTRSSSAWNLQFLLTKPFYNFLSIIHIATSTLYVTNGM